MTATHPPFAAFLLVVVVVVVVFESTVCAGFSSHPPRTTPPSTRRQERQQRDDRARLSPPRHRLPGRVELGDCDLDRRPRRATGTSLSMGVFDFLRENFLDSREGDFVPLGESDGEAPFGPGPLVLMYAVPPSMDDGELRDMVEDGMPNRRDDEVVIRRLSSMDEDGEGGDELLDLRVGDALEEAMKTASGPGVAVPTKRPIVVQGGGETQTPCPVLYFSGVSNAEMMGAYDIVANEIYEETGGLHWPACAKAVPPAMEKSLRRVLLEISGDHADAMRIRREEAKKLREEGLPGHDMPL